MRRSLLALALVATVSVYLVAQVTLTGPQQTATSIGLGTSSTPQFLRLGLGMAADASAALAITGQYYAVEVNAGNVSGSVTINWNTGIQHRMVATGNVTFTLTNPKAGGRYLLVLGQDATGSRTWTFPAPVKWSAGTAPAWTTTAGATDLCSLAFTGASGGIYLAACNLDIR